MRALKARSAWMPVMLWMLSACGGGGGGSADTRNAAFTVGGTISGLSGSGLVLQNNGGDDFTAISDGAFAFATTVASGGIYNVTVHTQPRNPVQTCTVSNGSGTVADSSVTTPVITCATSFGRFAYVPNSDGFSGHSISIYAVDAATGQLRAHGYFDTPEAPDAVRLDPSGRFLYVSNAFSDSLSAYRVNPASGELTEIAGSPFAAGALAVDIGIDPGGRFVYVANFGSDDISAYAIEGTTGALTPGAGSPFAAPGAPFAISVHPGGRFAYVVNARANNISTYTIAASTGALTLAGPPIATGSTPDSLRIDPSGKLAYVGNLGGNVSAYTIDAVSGALTPVAGSPFAAGVEPADVNTDPSGRFVYVANRGSSNVSVYRVDAATGSLSEVTGSPFFVANATPSTLLIDPTGRFAHVGNNVSHKISTYALDADTGALLPPADAAAATVSVRGLSQSIAMTAGAQALVFKPRFAYVANRDSDTISAYAIDGDTGALNAVTGSPFTAGDAPVAVSTHPSGRFVYVANTGSNDISAYAVDAASSVLTAVAGSPFVGAAPPLSSPTSIIADAGGRFLYVTSNFSSIASTFAIDGTTGALTEISSVSTGANGRPYSIEADPTGRFAYAANYDTNDVIAYRIARSGQFVGALLPGSSGGPFAVGTNPVSLGIDPSGRFLYVASSASNTVSAFAIDGTASLTSGALTAVRGSPFAAGTRPVSFSAEPSGRFAYVANEGSQDVSAYRINAASGALSAVAGGSVAAGVRPTSVRADPSGRFVYVADFASDAVRAYAIEPATGALTEIGGSPFATGGLGAIFIAVTGTKE